MVTGRKIFYAVMILLFPFGAKAQTDGCMYYTQRVQFNNSANPGIRRCALFFKGPESIAIVNYNPNAPIVENTTVERNSNNAVMKFSNKYPTVFYKNLDNKELISRDQAFMEIVVMNDTISNIDWTILPDKKQIGRFTCQKARAKVRGRMYTAWFTPDVPINTGPWKLYGLPGLILEAYDDSGEVKFIFESLEIPSPVKDIIKRPKAEGKQRTIQASDYIKVTQGNMDKMKKAMESSPGDGVITVKHDPIYTIELYPEK